MLIEYMPFLPLVIVFLVFPTAVLLGFKTVRPQMRSKILVLTNMAGAMALCFLVIAAHGESQRAVSYLEGSGTIIAIYFAVVGIHYGLLRRYAKGAKLLPWIPFVFPIVFLVLVKYSSILGGVIGNKTGAELFIGVSYMTFRLSYLTLECRWEAVETPGFWDYMGFAFFLPTLSVGPISTYRLHSESLMRAEPVLYTEALLRILKGVVKYVFLSNIINQFSYGGLLLDGRPHSRIDLVVAAFAFYVYLYLNFSGYCDMAIGTAKLLGIRVAENFDNPFRARNVKDFWNRWHITLSTYVRDVIFSPLSKALTFRWGIKNTNHAVAVAILAVFLVVGIWHGVGLNYLAFGLVQGLGVIANHYYAIFLKKRLGKQLFVAYSKNRTIEALSVCMTFTYTAASLFFFANDFRTAKRIVELVQ